MSNAPAIIAAEGPIRRRPIALLELARRNRGVLFGLALVGALFLLALAATVISPHDPIATEPDNAYLPPLSPGHVLGTDELGRDQISRILWGCVARS